MNTTTDNAAHHAGMRTAVRELRRQLIDVGGRNRLTNAPIGRGAKQLDIEDELADEVFRLLYRQGKKMAFKPAARRAEADFDLDQPGLPDAESGERLFIPDEDESAGPAARHVDTKLQTRLAPEALQKRLLTLYREAQTIEEEQGVSVLFLGLGFLRWYESESSEIERFAPLVLLPVDLQRDRARDRFRLAFRDQDLEPNLSLRARLQTDFDLTLPGLPDGPDWLPSEYFARVAAAVSHRPRWEVRPDLIELSFYSFAKFLMWKDLETAEAGGEINPLIEKLLTSGFGIEPGVFAPTENLDRRFPHPRELLHVMDADTSQTQVIAAARDGRNLVVQGPPGTGKSQTIANIVAAAVNDGKTVLFVAEKRAALDVVHARLEKCGLGPLCLELHSHKANRKEVYADLKRTLGLGEPDAVNEAHYERVRAVRDDLNRTSELLHRVDEATGETAYGMIGLLGKLSADGLPLPDFRIPGADDWSRAEYSERLDAAAVLADRTREFGSEREHVWRGAANRVGPIERQRLAERLRLGLEKFVAAREALASGAAAVGLADCRRFSAAAPVSAHLDALGAMPSSVPDLLQADAVAERPADVLALCEDAAALQEFKAGLLDQVAEAALEIAWDETRLEIGRRGRSPFRWLNGHYRNAVARLRSVQRGELPKSLDARLGLLDRLIEYRNRSRALANSLGRYAFGHGWRGADTDFDRLLPAMRWIAARAEALGSGVAVRVQVTATPDDCDFAGLLHDMGHTADEWAEVWESIQGTVGLDIDLAFGAEHIEEVEFDAIKSRLRAWHTDTASVEDWHRLRTAAQHATELGLDAFRERLADGRLRPEHARETLEFVRAEAVWERMRQSEPRLDAIDGRDRSDKIAEFRKIDQQLQELASHEVLLKHFRNLPQGAAGMVGIVRGEANKKKRHMRLRKLLDTAADAVAAIKPVFLMSPLSVAQYLSPGKLTFDLLLIDEASQVRPADAMGAIMRTRQIVVVGDRKQMPPTSFFERQVSGEDDAEPEEAADVQAGQIGDMESILSLCEARGMPGGMLRWHYRSRHPSLIAVSNHEFYDDGLVFPPSPDSAGASMGMSFTFVDGEYQRGKKRDNPREAQAVAEQVLAHARKRPDETLGVVALSVAQRDTILNKLEFMRTEYPELEAFCKESKEDPFFVKNLENVQGDERDVIFISVGYGKDAGGYMSQNFGPVSSEGGERRLNVLFTRARKQCRVFASIRYSDIRLDAIRHAGPRVLRRFLKYAETGEMDVPIINGGSMDSPFEEDVARTLERHGHGVEPQVGSAGFKIDLAVRDPDDAGRFLLAIECDGARYHSSSWARERDRLRQTVLEQKGWTFHRIWSTDWFHNRDAELRKLLDAIERARANRFSERTPAPVTPPTSAVRVTRNPRPEPAEPARPAYRQADFEITRAGAVELHEASAATLAPHVARIVAVEGPVHIDEVARRMSRLWGYKRCGRRIQEAVQRAVEAALHEGQVRWADDDGRRFLESPDGSPAVVRDRGGASLTLRKPDMLPPSEIEAAIREVVERNVGISVEDCAVEVARLFGIKSTSADLRAHLDAHAKRMAQRGSLAMHDGHLRLA